MSKEELQNIVKPLEAFFGVMDYLGPIFLIFAGLVCIAFKLYKNYKFKNREVVSVEATIIESSVKEFISGNSSRLMYQPKIKYSYVFRGSKYVSDRIYFGYEWSSTSSENNAKAISRKYRPSTRVTAYVDLTDHTFAYLESKPSFEWIFYLGGATFITFGLVFLILNLR